MTVRQIEPLTGRWWSAAAPDMMKAEWIEREEGVAYSLNTTRCRHGCSRIYHGRPFGREAAFLSSILFLSGSDALSGSTDESQAIFFVHPPDETASGTDRARSTPLFRTG